MPNDQQDWTSVIARPQTQLAGSPHTFGIGTTTQNFVLAPDTSIVAVLLPTFFNVDLITLTGHTSGFTYLKEAPLNSSFHPSYYAVINSAVDTSVDITVTCTIAIQAFVSSIPDPVASVLLPAQQAPWQAPNLTPQPMDFANPGAGNTATIIAAPINAQSIYLHSVQYIYTASPAGATGVFQDSNGTVLHADQALIAGQPYPWDFRGAKMAGGFALVYKQIGAAAANSYNIKGSVTYAVY